MNLKAVLLALVASTSFAVHAADGHKHAEPAAKYGGLVKEENDVQYELVINPDRMTLYVEDHGKKVDTKGASGKVTLRSGSERTEVTLQPAGDNKLEAMGTYKTARGTVAITQVKLAGRAEQRVRFTLK